LTHGWLDRPILIFAGHHYNSGAACDILDQNVGATRKQSKPKFSCNYLCGTLPTYKVWLQSVDI